MRRLAAILLAVVSSLALLASPALIGVSSATPPPDAPSVGLVGAPGVPAWGDEVASKLVATARFSSVTEVDAVNSTPSLATLEQYDSLLVYTDAGFNDPVTLGNELAQYVDDGGRLVVATFVWSGYGFANSTLGQAGYLPFTSLVRLVGMATSWQTTRQVPF